MKIRSHYIHVTAHVVSQQPLQSEGLAAVGAGKGGGVLLLLPTVRFLTLTVIQELYLQIKKKYTSEKLIMSAGFLLQG